MNPAIKLAMIATLFMGGGYPLLKVGQEAGVNAGWILIINGFSCMIIGSISFTFMPYINRWPQVTGALIVLAATLITNIGFLLTMHAFSLKGGLVSIVYIITSAAPLIAIIIGLVFLNEARSVIVPKLIFGALLVLTGAFFVSNSIK